MVELPRTQVVGGHTLTCILDDAATGGLEPSVRRAPPRLDRVEALCTRGARASFEGLSRSPKCASRVAQLLLLRGLLGWRGARRHDIGVSRASISARAPRHAASIGLVDAADHELAASSEILLREADAFLTPFFN